jgi:hypothetical protein
MADGNRHGGRKAKDLMRRAYQWSESHVPPGVRLFLGIPLILGGFLGFLPILGFWMVPLGAVLVALDVPPLRRRLRAWLGLPQSGATDRGQQAPP